MAGGACQGRRESRHDPQGPNVSLERPASRRRERGDSRQPAITRPAAESRAAGRCAAARTRDRRDDPPRPAGPAGARGSRLPPRAAESQPLRDAGARHATDSPTGRADRFAACLRRVRPGELRAQRLGDAREKTLLVERVANPDGTIKATKNEQRRAVRMLAPLAQDLCEYRLAIRRPTEASLLLVDDHGEAWDKTAWQMWRVDRWAPACRTVGLDPVPSPMT